MRKVLTAEFFDRSTLVVARELLGKFLVRKVGGKEIALMITETEAYHGFKDKASHASRGQTQRNTPMFGKPGYIYVYFTYGIHWMLNIVCGKENFPAAVLIRGARSSTKISRNRSTVMELRGPAILTKFLDINKSLNTFPLTKKSGLWIEDRGVVIKLRDIERTPRIGINYAEEYIDKPWRFVIKKP